MQMCCISHNARLTEVSTGFKRGGGTNTFVRCRLSVSFKFLHYVTEQCPHLFQLLQIVMALRNSQPFHKSFLFFSGEFLSTILVSLTEPEMEFDIVQADVIQLSHKS